MDAVQAVAGGAGRAAASPWTEPPVIDIPADSWWCLDCGVFAVVVRGRCPGCDARHRRAVREAMGRAHAATRRPVGRPAS